MPDENGRPPARFTDPLQAEPVDDVVAYAWAPEGPVRISEVRADGAVMGWLWADDPADAAGYLPSADTFPASAMLGTSWELRLRNAKARGLTPTQALIEAAEDGPSAMGQAGRPSAEAIPFEQLKAMAGELPRPEPAARDRRR